MSTTDSKPSTYLQGHPQQTLVSHSLRNVSTSAAYLAPHLLPTQTLLDVGCGPGSITIDFASRVKHAVGVDQAEKAVEAAKKAKSEQGVDNVEFRVGDVARLEFEDGTFDVVHSHQVIMYLPSPRSHALREMRRVTKPGGLVALCEGDWGTFAIHPPSPTLTNFHTLFYKVMAHKGGDADSGRQLLSYALEAGFDKDKIEASVNTWLFTKREEVRAWSEVWRDRLTTSGIGSVAVEQGFASREEVEEMVRAWEEWAEKEDAWFMMSNGQVLCRV